MSKLVCLWQLSSHGCHILPHATSQRGEAGSPPSCYWFSEMQCEGPLRHLASLMLCICSAQASRGHSRSRFINKAVFLLQVCRLPGGHWATPHSILCWGSPDFIMWARDWCPVSSTGCPWRTSCMAGHLAACIQHTSCMSRSLHACSCFMLLLACCAPASGRACPATGPATAYNKSSSPFAKCSVLV